ncbi:MAG TPA: hypothetical protein VEA39_04110 [Methylophilaceae bacterium]|nr:hypothetical protein [Methylophilaceae bacterium]
MSAHYFLVRLWFVANVLLALLPPLHWEIAAQRPVLGLPATLFYFLLLSLSITGSILYAYWEECVSGEFRS